MVSLPFSPIGGGQWNCTAGATVGTALDSPKANLVSAGPRSFDSKLPFFTKQWPSWEGILRIEELGAETVSESNVDTISFPFGMGKGTQMAILLG